MSLEQAKLLDQVVFYSVILIFLIHLVALVFRQLKPSKKYEGKD